MKFFEPTTLIIILVIVLIIFGPSRLPQLGKSLGKTMKALREGVDGKGEDEEEADAPEKDEKKAAAAAKKDDEDA